MYCAFLRILEVEPPPVVQVCRRRAHRVRDAGNHAWPGPEVLTRIVGNQPPQAIRVTAYITERGAPVGPELPLDARVPRLRPRRMDVGRDRAKRSKRRERRRPARRDRMRIAAKMRIRRVHASRRIRQPQQVAVRRTGSQAEPRLGDREVVVQPIGRAHRHPAVAEHVPGQADARRHVLPLPLESGTSLGESLVAGIDEPGRRVHELRALDAAAEVIQAEVGDCTLGNLLTEERLPADARIQRQALGGAPGVLRVPALVQLVEVHAEVRAMLEDRYAAEQEVGEAEAGDAAIERPRAATLRP